MTLQERFLNLRDKNGTFWQVYNDIPNPDAWFRDVVMTANKEDAEDLIAELEVIDAQNNP